MASKQISPAAQLLRHSKLFSVPQRLRKPIMNDSATISRHESDSATGYYPTHAAIHTTNRGRKKGDWGLKRNLPIRKTASRPNPIIQVKAVDNIDHVTDYETATPHAITLRKFQEMNIPVTVPEFAGERMARYLSGNNRSVFDRYEPTRQRETTLVQSEALSDEARAIEALAASTVDQQTPVERWKFRGPWLAGMDDSAFQRYLKKEVATNRAAFKQFLRSWMLKTKASKTKAEQMATGTMNSETEIQLSEEEYESWLVELRQEGKQLYALMWEFLDLPGHPPSERHDQSRGPPATHPSAGLSYLRTNSILPNHPALGPMYDHQPVQARVLRGAATASGRQNEKGDAVGIGGFVSTEHRNIEETRLNRSLMYGEKKRYVVPDNVKIDERGRIQIDYHPANRDSVAVWEMEYDATEQTRAQYENDEIDRLTQRPASMKAMFGGLRKLKT